MLCICGKPADKKCSRCKFKSYCSVECQRQDFPHHKKVCKFVAEHSKPSDESTANVNNAVDHLRRLPEVYAANPWPTALGPKVPSVPVNHLAGLFKMLFLTQLQSQMVSTVAPALVVVRHNQELTVLTLNAADKPPVQHQTFIPFRAFNGNSLLQGSSMAPTSEDDMRCAYLMMSFAAKCNQIASCFGLLVLRTLQTHRLTYVPW